MLATERIVVVVSDIGRNCLYTLSSKGSIAIYKINGARAVQHLQTLSNLFKTVQDRAPGYPALSPKNFQIISVHVVNQWETRSGIQFFAMTSSGVRLYFAPSGGASYSSVTAPGSTFAIRPVQLIHIRLPPSNLAHPDAPFQPPVNDYGSSQITSQSISPPYVISSIENTCYSEGLTIATQQGATDGTDYILCMAPDLTRIGKLGQMGLPLPRIPSTPSPAALGDSRPPLTEYATILAIPGRTWAMATVPKVSSAASPGVPPAVLNELAMQFGEYPGQFLLLTNVGLTFLAKRRALDYLKAVLEELQSEGNVQPLIHFRDRLATLFSLFIQ